MKENAMGKRKNRSKHRGGQGSSGSVARLNAGELRTYRVGALPIINQVLRRAKMKEIVCAHLLAEDGRTKLPLGEWDHASRAERPHLA